MTPDHKHGIIPTTISRNAARIFVIGFLVVIFTVPWLTRGWGNVFPLFRHVPGAADLRAFEESVEEASRARKWVQPRLQTLASLGGGFGNSKAVIGRDGWLFYRPDVELLTNPAKANPLPAIRDFHKQLAARGIQLILLPAPAKPMLHPEPLGGAGAPLYCRTWPALRRELEADGIVVFDSAPLIVSNRLAYLKTDTHWRPETMELVARELAKSIRDLPAVDAPDDDDHARVVTNTGDIAVMLGVTYPKETVTIRPVQKGDQPWESSDDADVLLLGDSFANIYSGRELKWGVAAGLAERLSFHLKRPLDTFIRNDAGAYATRLMLAQQPERLRGKRVVIWEFAARELAWGDWKVFHIAVP